MSAKVKTRGDNRRKHERMEASKKITLLRQQHADQIIPHFRSKAYTIDLSQGGMRLATDKPLINDSVIELSFGKNVPKSLQLVTGQVAWCNKQIDDPGYQTGIFFKGERTIKEMSRYLEHANKLDGLKR